MSEVKWIKITTNMFEDEKIDFIESLPEADAILVIWIKLLAQAGKNNMDGFIFLTEKIPYTDEMLSHKFRRPLSTVKLALQTLKHLEMIDFNEEGFLKVSNWEKHQNIEGLDKIREQNRLRQAKYREKQKQLESSNVTVTLCNGTEVELEEELDIDKDNKEPLAPYITIKELFNKKCKGLSNIRTISKERERHIKARWKQYDFDIEVFKELFNKAEASNFLKGQNDRGWKANFDWLINENNMAKVLEGRYENAEHRKPNGGGLQGTNTGLDSDHTYDIDELEKKLLQRNRTG